MVEGAPNIAHENTWIDVLDRVLDHGVIVDESLREHEHAFYSIAGVLSAESDILVES